MIAGWCWSSVIVVCVVEFSHRCAQPGVGHLHRRPRERLSSAVRSAAGSTFFCSACPLLHYYHHHCAQAARLLDPSSKPPIKPWTGYPCLPRTSKVKSNRLSQSPSTFLYDDRLESGNTSDGPVVWISRRSSGRVDGDEDEA